ncbi:hypothetical protein ABGT22_24930 [Peribacillus frigoritolerans]|uniref:hypothetical protein n=1 Tax=Peribacillus frigoritolerans TaxID=450367 RepID=UPI00345D1DE1
MASQKNYLIVGLLLSFLFIVRLILSLMTDAVSVVELLNWGTLAYMGFAISYLYPQFKDKDERTEAIRQKGMYHSLYIVLVVLIALMVLIEFNTLTLTTIEIVRVMISVIIITIWTSWIFLSKRM